MSDETPVSPHPYYPPEKPTGSKRILPTPEMRQKIVDVINVTGSDKDAFILAGISNDTFYAWYKEGRECRAAGRKCCFSDFAEAIERARANRKLSLVGNIRRAGLDKKHWTANAWLLERTEAREYAKQLRLHINDELSDAIKRLRAALPAEEYERALAALVEGDRSTGAEQDPRAEDGADDSGSEALLAALPKPEAGPLPGTDV